MFEYSRKSVWGVDKVQFECLDGWYRGRGLLSWSPEVGFHLDAFLERLGQPLPRTIEIGKIRMVTRSESSSIHLWLEDGMRGYASGVLVNEDMDLIGSSRLSIDLPSLTLSRSLPTVSRPTGHFGTALLEVGKGLMFPDPIERVTFLGKSKIKIGHGAAADGIDYEDESLKLAAWKESETQLHIEWRLLGDSWARSDAWRWTKGVASALSFLGGRTVQVLERRTKRGKREIIERLKERAPFLLRIFSLAPRSSREPVVIDKYKFIKLARFFARDRTEVRVSRHICEQMADACRQTTWGARELLCATTLEAALRTIEDQPFTPKRKDNKWDAGKSMARFRDRFLSRKWKSSCRKAITTCARIRHRNAHPDWVVTQDDALSHDEPDTALDDMIWLCWFYGYMILALAGFVDLEPKFPVTHKQWGPMMTVTQGVEK